MVRSKEESWNWFEVDEGGEMVSVRWSGEVGKHERMSETLVKKYLLKESARVEGSVCVGKDAMFLF